MAAIRRWLTTRRNMRRFTEYSLVAMGLASRCAVRCRAPAIGPSHILYGLLSLGKGVCASVLSECSVSAGALAEQLSREWQWADDWDKASKLSLASCAKDVVNAAIGEANWMIHKEITSGHLLIGVLCSPGDPGATLLAEQGLKLRDAREKLEQIMDRPGASQSERWVSEQGRWKVGTPLATRQAVE